MLSDIMLKGLSVGHRINSIVEYAVCRLILSMKHDLVAGGGKSVKFAFHV